MKITYLKLSEVAGIRVGQGKETLEIDLSGSKHRIISLQGSNGSAKTTVLSSLHPFATVTTLDERSSIPYITPGKPGYKEIRYDHDGSTYTVKHHFKPNLQGTHSVKSYFQRDNEELNPNGNVGSFLSLVEVHFGLTPDMMRLIRLGSNVNSIVSLRPAERKSYIGRLIEEIDLYLRIHRKISDDVRLTKLMMTNNVTNLRSCHVADPKLAEEQLRRCDKKIADREERRNNIRLQVDRIERLQANHDIGDLRRKQAESESSLAEFDQVESEIQARGLTGIESSDVTSDRSKLVDHQVDARSRLNSTRMLIDSNLASIDRLNANVARISGNGDLETLKTMIAELSSVTENTPNSLREFHSSGCRSEEVSAMISRLLAFNQVGTMIQSFGSKPLSLYLQLHRGGKSIERYIYQQMKKQLARISDSDIKRLISQVFQDDYIITPNCESEFSDCPYYRFSSFIAEYRNRPADDTVDEETLRYLRVIDTNLTAIISETATLKKINIPEGFKDILTEISFLGRAENKLPLFDTDRLQDYLCALRDSEIYREQVDRLAQCRRELRSYQSSGTEQQLSEIERLRSEITGYQGSTKLIEQELVDLQAAIMEVDSKLSLLKRYDDAKRYRGIVTDTLRSISDILIPLETAEGERQAFRSQLVELDNDIASLRSDYRLNEQRLIEYQRLVDESKKLTKTYSKLTVIARAVSTKGGIPIAYMNSYLGMIQSLTNDLLSIIYEGELVIGRFNVTADEFEIPFIRNGKVIPDIRFASQSEESMMTMALSFALAHEANQRYNILLLDEIDGGLDDDNRLAFLRMLDKQMMELNSVQAFVISQHVSTMLNLPCDVIRLSDTGFRSSLQNVIYG